MAAAAANPLADLLGAAVNVTESGVTPTAPSGAVKKPAGRLPSLSAMTAASMDPVALVAGDKQPAATLKGASGAAATIPVRTVAVPKVPRSEESAPDTAPSSATASGDERGPDVMVALRDEFEDEPITLEIGSAAVGAAGRGDDDFGDDDFDEPGGGSAGGGGAAAALVAPAMRASSLCQGHDPWIGQTLLRFRPLRYQDNSSTPCRDNLALVEWHAT